MAKARFTPIFDRKKTLEKNPDKKTAVIQVRVTLHRKSKFISTGIMIEPNQWDANRMEIKKHKNAASLNFSIKEQISKMEALELDINRDFEKGLTPYPFRLENLDDAKKREKHQGLTFTDFYQEQIEKDKTLMPNTIKNHKSSLKRLCEFKETILFQDLTYEFVKDYERFLIEYQFEDGAAKKLKSLSSNRIYFYLKNFKAMVNRAVEYEIIKPENNPFDRRFKLTKYRRHEKNTLRRYLEPEEVFEIEKLRFDEDEKYLEKIRDCFLVQCYTGLSYTDITSLKKSSLIMKKGQGYVLELPRGKTDEIYYVPLYKLFARKPEILIKKYISDDRSFIFEYTVQYLNRQLKIISKRAGISKRVTTHVGRHTCAVLLIELGVSMEVVQEILGHSSIKTTQIYAKVIRSAVDKALDKVDFSRL